MSERKPKKIAKKPYVPPKIESVEELESIAANCNAPGKESFDPPQSCGLLQS